MNRTELVERLDGILDDLPAEAQRQFVELKDIVEELREQNAPSSEGSPSELERKAGKTYRATWTAIIEERRTCQVVAQDKEEAKKRAKEGSYFGPPGKQFLRTLNQGKIEVEETSS